MSNASQPLPGQLIPGELIAADGEVAIVAADVELTELRVVSLGDRPIQVGSHFHFFEVNEALSFDRASAYGMRLAIPAGTAVRFEPGEARIVQLRPISGNRVVHGFKGWVNGALDDPAVKEAALAKAAPGSRSASSGDSA